MAITIKHNKGTNVIPIKKVGCKAAPLTDILSSKSWRDRTCFLIGGGPSLKNFNFNYLRQKLSIGINKSFTEYATTINYAMDKNDKIIYLFTQKEPTEDNTKMR